MARKETNIAQRMADDSTSGIVPIFGALLLVAIIIAIISVAF